MPAKEDKIPDASPAPSPDLHRRLRRRLWLLLALLAAVGAATATAPTGWLPRLANALICEYLRVRDLSAIQVRVERLTPWHLRAALQFGTNDPVSRIERLEARFSPGSLWRHGVAQVDVDGGLLQFRTAPGGVSVCGLPSGLRRLSPGTSPLADEDDVPVRWQVGKLLLDNVTLRLLPPEAGAAPFDICLHASAVTDPQGETRFAISDYGRAGTLANGAFRFETGDGWLVAVLPESQVQEWLRVAQWFMTNPRFQGSDLCAGNGGATLLARMEQWRPALVQGDLSLRAATLLQDCSFTYDLRLHGVAQWEMADSLRPTITANAQVGLRMASFPAFAWSDDHEQPASASVAVKLTPRKAEWECQVAARGALSHEAAQVSVPTGSVQLPEAPVFRIDGVFTSPDLATWDGAIEAMAIVPQPRLPAGDMALACRDLVVQATATVTHSQPAVVRGRVDLSGVSCAGRGIRLAGDAGVSFGSSAPFQCANVAVTAGVASLTLPAGAVSFDKDEPLRMIASATLARAPDGRVSVCAAELNVAPQQMITGNTRLGLPDGLQLRMRRSGENPDGMTVELLPAPVAGQSGTGMAATAWVSAAAFVGRQRSSTVSCGDMTLRVTNVLFRAAELTGGVASADVTVSNDKAGGLASRSAPRIRAEISGAWLRGRNGLQLDGLQALLPLECVDREIRVAGLPGLTWRNLECQGVHLVPEGFALSLTGQTAAVQMSVGVLEANLHASLGVYADWSRAWQVAVTAEVPPSTLADTEALRGMIWRLADMDLVVTGQVAATVSALLAKDLPPSVKVSAAVGNLDVGCLSGKWQVSGLSAGLTADGPRAWRTPQGQVLTFRSARSGDLALDGGALRWQYRREALLVEQADVNWCGGSLHAFGVPYDPREQRLETVLYAERIELGRLMAQTRMLQGSGAGRLYGRLPLTLDKGKVKLSESYLYSTPGETGSLKLSNTAPIELAMEQGSIDAATRQKVSAALQNMQYSLFRMDLSGGGANASLGIQIEGRAAEDAAAPPVHLNVNLGGSLDEFFNFGMDLSRKLR
ncbi:MAG: YdbH domain-containing protein [bacterium]